MPQNGKISQRRVLRAPEQGRFRSMATTDSGASRPPIPVGLRKVDAMPPEQVVGMARNGWSASIGIAGRHGPDYARVTHSPQDEVDYAGYDSSDYVQVIELELLQNEIQYCLDILESTETCPLTITREGIFLAGQSYDAYTSIRDILSSATRSIDLIDGYISSEVLDRLAVKRDGVQVRVLTKTIKAEMRAAIQAFNQQYKYSLAQMRTEFELRDEFEYNAGFGGERCAVPSPSIGLN